MVRQVRLYRDSVPPVEAQRYVEDVATQFRRRSILDEGPLG